MFLLRIQVLAEPVSKRALIFCGGFPTKMSETYILSNSLFYYWMWVITFLPFPLSTQSFGPVALGAVSLFLFLCSVLTGVVTLSTSNWTLLSSTNLLNFLTLVNLTL